MKSEIDITKEKEALKSDLKEIVQSVIHLTQLFEKVLSRAFDLKIATPIKKRKPRQKKLLVSQAVDSIDPQDIPQNTFEVAKVKRTNSKKQLDPIDESQ